LLQGSVSLAAVCASGRDNRRGEATPVVQTTFRKLSHQMERLAVWTTMWTGSSWAFILAAGMVVVWLVSGPLFHYSDTWQLVMNTISSIVTFLMVFLIQRSQNKDTLAMQIKLNEIIAALKGASNRLINVEDLSEDEVRELHRRYQELAADAQKNGNRTQRLSIEQELPHSEPGPETVGR
jgi:low affinity Fe/Cu permease